MKIDKKKLREEYILIRNNIVDKVNKSNIIFNKIINTSDYTNTKVIAIYKSLKNEVDTSKLIEYSLNDKKIVLLPKVNGEIIDFYKIDSKTNYIKSNFGVEEPIGEKYNGKIDLIIVPGICFDRDRNRIGFGKGYYDKYLSNHNIKTIAICFDEQILENDYIDSDDYDFVLDKIISDKRII